MSDSVADRLRRCKERTGLSFSVIQERTGISRSHLSNSHTGKMPISTDALEQLAPVYGTTVAWLRDGVPEVDVWSRLQESPEFIKLGSSTVSPGERTSAVINFASRQYPGHLDPGDISSNLSVSRQLVDDVRNLRRPPTDEFMRAIAQLTSVPYAWLQIGNAESLHRLSPQDGWSVEQLRRWLEVAKRAESMGVSPDDMGAILTIMGKNKGGA
jgi:transcriptional regulator with XRE-family HTH domain